MTLQKIQSLLKAWKASCDSTVKEQSRLFRSIDRLSRKLNRKDRLKFIDLCEDFVEREEISMSKPFTKLDELTANYDQMEIDYNQKKRARQEVNSPFFL